MIPSRATEESTAQTASIYQTARAQGQQFLRETLLPLTRYFAYIECPAEHQTGQSSLWVEYQELQRPDLNFAMRRVYHPSEIYPVFRDLFRKERVT